jgi:ATP-dependent DNA helicase HFM1/MER3
MNEQPVITYQRKLVMVSFLAETSDGRKAHFAHIRYLLPTSSVAVLADRSESGQRLGRGQELTFEVLLKHQDQVINCYVSCDEIGTYVDYYLMTRF